MKLIAALFLALSSASLHAAELVMVEQPGCVWCQRFDAEIAPGYPNTEEGKRAPLRRADLRQPWPGGITVKEGARFTPTFILLDDNGKELGRFVGYPGDQFFYPALGDLLKKLPGKVP
jgi:thioredoxin-related protein